MRIFLDANILFSASLPKSHVRALLDVANGHAPLLTNLYAAEEARRNLELKKPRAVVAFEKLLSKCKVSAVATTQITTSLAEKDVPILGGAIASNATHLLTGDKRDFGALWGKTIQGVKIVSPQMLTDELVKKGLVKRKH